MALSLWWSTIFAKKINPLGRRGLKKFQDNHFMWKFQPIICPCYNYVALALAEGDKIINIKSNYLVELAEYLT